MQEIESERRRSSACDDAHGDRSGATRVLCKLAALSFTLLATFMLTTPSWYEGVFAWLPLMRLPYLFGSPVSVGVLALFAPLFVIGWAGERFFAWRSLKTFDWTWGRFGVTAPLLLLTIVSLARLDLAFPRIVFVQVVSLVIFWLFYLYLLNERPPVVALLAAVILIQSIVSMGQFLSQGDLVLEKFGELPLDPLQPGISVIFAREQRWLRGYGLTAHPNLLGAMLAACLLLLLPTLARSRDRRRLLLMVTYVLGLSGLLVTFSRAAILAYGAGFSAWLFLEHKDRLRRWSSGDWRRFRPTPTIVLAGVLILAFLVFFGDLAFSRIVGLDSPLEAVSINQRLFDARLALEVFARHPFLGAGLGQFNLAAREISDYAAIVHNVPLLVAAELGLAGLLPLLWLGLSGLRGRHDALAVWLAVLIIGLFDITLWLTGNWQTAILFALVCANLSRNISSGNGPIQMTLIVEGEKEKK